MSKRSSRRAGAVAKRLRLSLTAPQIEALLHALDEVPVPETPELAKRLLAVGVRARRVLDLYAKEQARGG